MPHAGIDIGSTTVKLIVLDHGRVAHRAIRSSLPDPAAAAREMLGGIAVDGVVATGYGRALLGVPTISEIKGHAVGARALCPDASAVIDIGGQDVKVIGLDANGRAARFELNDRCAAGTGRFLEVMAQRLGYTQEEFASAALAGDSSVTISAMCTVFAESEVVGLVGRGVPMPAIARALHRSVVVRIAAMFRRICTGAAPEVALTGGGSRNRALVSMLGQELGTRICAPDGAQFAGALGCAVTARGCRLS